MTTDVEKLMGEIIVTVNGIPIVMPDKLHAFVSELVSARVSIAELEGARAKAMEGAAPGFADSFEMLGFSGWQKIVAITGNQRKSIAVELDRRADIIAAQAAELERLRLIENVIANLIDPHTDLRHIAEIMLDRATAQSEPSPCTGAEFSDAAQKAIEPRSDEKIRQAINETEAR